MAVFADMLNYEEKVTLCNFIKYDLPMSFLGNNEDKFMFVNYSTVFIGADEILYNIHNYKNPLATFNAEQLLGIEYNNLKNRLSQTAENEKVLNYFSIYENTIKILDKVKKQIICNQN